MNKHLLMLSAAVTALLAQPVSAATTISTIGTTAINTKSDGDITISSGGGIALKQAGAAVTINSNNGVANGGKIANIGTDSAKGILIDASGGAITSVGFTNTGTIDLSGAGGTKTAIDLSGGTFTGPITLSSGGTVRVQGDNSTGVLIEPNSTLTGTLSMGGTLSMSPTSANTLTAGNVTLVDIGGTVNGNVALDSTASFTGTGEGTRGIVVLSSGTINGTLSNGGNLTLAGNVLSATSSSKGTRPEAGSALVVSGNVTGGIVNAGPFDTNLSVPSATLASSGLSTTNGAQAVVLISPNGVTLTNPLVIGPDNTDAGDGQTGFSLYNRGTISAAPLNTNNSTTAILIAGQSSVDPTILTGGIFNAGAITATATSTNGTGAANVAATAISIGAFAQMPKIKISGESITSSASSFGTVSATVSGQVGGTASGIVIGPNASVTELDVAAGAKIKASATTTEPTTATLLSAFGVVDASQTLTTINNAGTISAIVTTLTPGTGVTVQTNGNVAEAINVAGTTGKAVTINNAGTIVGDVLLNSTGDGTVFNIGAGTAKGGDPTQVADAAAAATATGLTNTPAVPATVTGNVTFGTGASRLNVNDSGTLTGALTSANGTLDVAVSKNGTLTLTNTTSTAQLHDLTVNGGTLGISVSEALRSANAATITASDKATLASNTALAVSVGSFVPQGTHSYVLISAPSGGLTIDPADLARYQTNINNTLPFFFNSASSALIESPDASQLALQLTPKTAAQLGLTGDALTMFNAYNQAATSVPAVTSDTALGSAIVNGIADPAKGIGTTAEDVFSQFAPDVSGDVRAVAVALTDQASGPVAARQRLLRQYANQEGDFSLWGQEFAQYINNKGRAKDASDLTNYKDHGFGFSLGLDTGNPQAGWYGGAFTFFAGDASQTLPRDSKTQTQWYMLTGYTDWRGPHLFLDTQGSIAVGDFKGKRFLSIALPASGGNAASTFTREADSKRAGLMGAIGATTGAVFNWGSAVVMPTISLDGMTLREEGFNELNGGNGFDLKVNPYYATSARGYFGVDLRQDVDIGDFTVQPEGRIGYRYELLNDPIKVKAQFESGGVPFTITGPDPTRGNVVAGATIGASTDTWSMGVNFDWVRGTNGSQTEVGTVSLLGRI